MRKSHWKRKLNLLLLAAAAAGTLTVPVVSAQSSASTTSKKPAHKTSNASSSHPATSHSSTTHKGTAHSSTTATHYSSSASASKKSTKSATSRRKTRTKKVKGQAAPTPERINEIQEALARKGAFTGTPTGAWDDSTVDAMKKFQSTNGLSPTGKLDALTLQKLGLGSETAGIAAPILPPNSANRLINTTPEPSN
jgi:peptidoglycan hydrolase-like protein with peptidoglycan-binding domain